MAAAYPNEIMLVGKGILEVFVSADASVVRGEDTMFYVAWWPELSKGGWLVPQVWWWGGMGPHAHELHACFVCAGGWITRSNRAGTKAGAARTNAGAAPASVPGGRFNLKSIPFTNAGAAPA